MPAANPNVKVLEVARGEIGVTEKPVGSNLGPRVNEYKAETWFSPTQPWPWCVAFVLWVIHRALGRKFPYETASVSQLAAYARKHGLTTTRPEPGDAACLGADHITFVDSFTGDSFIGVGGNQANRVQRSTYMRSRVTTWIDTSAVATFLGLPPPPKPRKPLWEVVRGEGGQRKVVYTAGRKGVTRKAGVLIGKAVKFTVRPKKQP